MPQLEKRYIYKLYSNNVFVGTLKNVVSEYGTKQDINTSGVELQISLAETLESAGAVASVDYLVTDNIENIVTDEKNKILTRQAFGFTNTPINLANRVKVFVYYDNAPNGLQVFDGFIFEWEAAVLNGVTTLRVLSHGVKLDHYLVKVIPGTTIAENVLSDGLIVVYPEWKTALGRVTAVAQTFTAPTTTTGNQVTLTCSTPGGFATQATLSIVEGTPLSPGSTLASVTRVIPMSSDQVDVIFTLPEFALLIGQTYHIKLETEQFGLSETNVFTVPTDSTAGFAGGTAYVYTDSTGWGAAAYDLRFNLSAFTAGLGNSFDSADPSDVVRSVVDSASGQGGLITYDNDSIDDTGNLVTYTFKLSTVYEAAQKALELAPGNWYYYTDIADNLFHFHRKGDTADHTFILGRHMQDLLLKRTLEGVINHEAFSGGDDGTGVNVYVEDTNGGSINDFGPWLNKDSDNRVTLQETAEILARSTLEQNSTPFYRTTVIVSAETYDIEIINPGEMVQFNTGNSLADSLLLQIVSLSKTPHSASLTLSQVPPSISKRVEDIRRNLQKQETINNPEGV